MSDELEPVSETRNKGGRPRKLNPDEATLKQLRGLGQLQCTVRECAAFLQVSPVTFEAFLKLDGVRDAFEEGQANGRVSLRRTQFRLAEKNANMAIFLGKQYLDQRDHKTHEHSGPNGTPIPYTDMTADERRARIAELQERARAADGSGGD